MKRQETDLKAICARLESLSHSQPSEVHRREVEDALHSKWDGVQIFPDGRMLSLPIPHDSGNVTYQDITFDGCP